MNTSANEASMQDDIMDDIDIVSEATSEVFEDFDLGPNDDDEILSIQRAIIKI